MRSTLVLITEVSMRNLKSRRGYQVNQKNKLYPEEYDNLVKQTSELRYSEDYTSIRKLLYENGYDSRSLIQYAIDHVGGKDACIRVTTYNEENIIFIIRESNFNEGYNEILEKEVVDFIDGDEEDETILSIIRDKVILEKFELDCKQHKSEP